VEDTGVSNGDQTRGGSDQTVFCLCRN